MSHPIVVAFTGGSGPGYGRRLVEVLLELQQPVHLTISPAATKVIEHELDISIDLKSFTPELFWPDKQALFSNLHYYHYQDFMTPMASGSFLTRGMVICPCSGATLSAAANGNSRNLIERAAEVHLKESRKLILVQRETPLSLPTIENMRKAKLAGAVILPAMPAWYHGDQSVTGLIDFVVARILDQLNIEHHLIKRWGEGIENGD
ncbi:MAG: UbiX family flavin prenyltransferase [Planctomycetaceae bacterium]|nr:UbiX family flavin prenyltransferase [Planctomycetaceae bacterium]MCP4461328.1 UbiX family flavin prenyltransferase [Planctomycetaceae bacterium]MDG1806748.1 UbiX family flavin prenyltransferase [Pirellulaceae bacterium]MDG2103787.1 UbiX family flavin prenyltransferase [Pirellulaceae bacterium]